MAGLEEAQRDNKAAEQAADKGDGKDKVVPPNLLDLIKENNELPKMTKTDLLQGAEPLAMPLNHYLFRRTAQEDDQSYYKLGATYLTRFGRHLIGAEDASGKFDEARKFGNRAAMSGLQHADHEQREFEERFSHYTGAILRTALLFSGGKVGVAALAAISAAEQTRPNDSFNEQLADAVMGAAKGLSMRYAFNQITAQPWNPIVQGWTLGMSNRLLDVGLTRRTYLDPNGNFDKDSFLAGGQKTLASVFSPQSLLVDGGAAIASGLTLLPIDFYTRGSFLKNVVASNLTIAGVSGLTEGSLRDLNRQQDDPRQLPIDWMEIAKKGLQKGTIDAISALPSSGIIK